MKTPATANRNFTFLHVAFVLTAYFLLLNSFAYTPFHDNAIHHIPYFTYFSNSFLHGYKIPLWYPWEGGIPVGLTSISRFPFLPHRLLGYFLYAFLPFDAISMYKTTVILGMMSVGVGWWFFLNKLTGSKFGATVGCLVVLLGGTGITVIHQEQIVATMTWIPWMLLALMQIKKQFNYIFVLAVLFGFSLTTHYPHIQLLTILFVLSALVLTGRVTRLFKKRETVNKKNKLIPAFFLFIMAASPAFYTIKVKNEFASPLRQSERLGAATYRDYVNLNEQQRSSAPFGYFGRYLFNRDKGGSVGDIEAFFVGITALLLAVLGAVMRYKTALPVMIVLALCVWATSGIYGYLPQLLFVLKFPFIGVFRQWYHFFPMVNFCLSALAALGVSAFFGSIPGFNIASNRNIGLFLTAIVVVALAYECVTHYSGYVKRYRYPYDVPRFTNNQFLDWVEDKVEKPRDRHELVVYKERKRLYQVSGKAAVGVPFSTTSIYNDIGIPASSRDEVLKKFFDLKLDSGSVVASIPLSEVKKISIRNLSSQNRYDFEVSNLENNHIFSRDDFVVTPNGASLKGKAASERLVVLPFCYKMNLDVYLNGQSVEPVPVYGGGMIGIFVPEGNFNIKLNVTLSWYYGTLFIKLVLLVFVFWLTYHLRFRNSYA